MSHRRFMGWEPATVHLYDAAGRLRSSRPEPEWDAEERALMFALDELEASQCPSCHLPLDETTDPANDGRYEAHSETCFACRAMAAAHDKIANPPKGSVPAKHLHALLWRTELKPLVKR